MSVAQASSFSPGGRGQSATTRPLSPAPAISTPPPPSYENNPPPFAEHEVASSRTETSAQSAPASRDSAADHDAASSSPSRPPTPLPAYSRSVRTNVCGICLETNTAGDVICLCGHVFCAECMLGYVRSKVQEHQYPILCPLCMTWSANSTAQAVLPDFFVLALDLMDEERSIYAELALARATSSVPVSCRRCENTTLVNKAEYDANPLVTCPFSGCGHVWCRKCSKTAIPDTRHDCCGDGTTELQLLMRRNGWRYCPGCQTPTSHTPGCNHAMCLASGCNTHFCCRCGELLTRSLEPARIQHAKSVHYSSCKMIDDAPPQRSAEPAQKPWSPPRPFDYAMPGYHPSRRPHDVSPTGEQIRPFDYAITHTHAPRPVDGGSARSSDGLRHFFGF